MLVMQTPRFGLSGFGLEVRNLSRVSSGPWWQHSGLHTCHHRLDSPIHPLRWGFQPPKQHWPRAATGQVPALSTCVLQGHLDGASVLSRVRSSNRQDSNGWSEGKGEKGRKGRKEGMQKRRGKQKQNKTKNEEAGKGSDTLQGALFNTVRTDCARLTGLLGLMKTGLELWVKCNCEDLSLNPQNPYKDRCGDGHLAIPSREQRQEEPWGSLTRQPSYQ